MVFVVHTCNLYQCNINICKVNIPQNCQLYYYNNNYYLFINLAMVIVFQFAVYKQLYFYFFCLIKLDKVFNL